MQDLYQQVFNQFAFVDFMYSRFAYLVDGTLGMGALLTLVLVVSVLHGIKWRRDVWPTVKSDPSALAHLSGMVFLSLALFVGLLAIAGAIQ